MNEPTLPPLVPKVVLALPPTQNDLDFAAARDHGCLCSGRREVYYLILTDGGKGK